MTLRSNSRYGRVSHVANTYMWSFHQHVSHMSHLMWKWCLFGQSRPRSACTSTQSDQGLHCLLTESLDTTECMNGEQRPGWYFAHVQDDLNLHILRMFEGTFHYGWIYRCIKALITASWLDLYCMYKPEEAFTLKMRFLTMRLMSRIVRKCVFWVNANSTDPDQPAEIYNLIRNLVILSYVLQYPMILYSDIEDPDQTARIYFSLQQSQLFINACHQHSNKIHTYTWTLHKKSTILCT